MLSRAVKSPFLFPVLAAILVVTWSSGFVGIRFASENAPISLVLFWRNLVSGLALAPFALLIGAPIGIKALLQNVAFGCVGMFLYLASFAVAIAHHVPTGLVALISDLVPLAIAVLSQPLLGHGLTRRQWMGTAIGVAGVVVASLNSIAIGQAPLLAYLLPVGGMVLFAAMTVVQKRLKAVDIPIYQSLAVQCLTAAACFAPWAWYDVGIGPLETRAFLLGVTWLVVLSTFICYSVYYIMLRHYPPSEVSSIVFLSPPVTMLWAWLIFDEPLTLVMAAGFGLTLIGVYYATRQGSE